MITNNDLFKAINTIKSSTKDTILANQIKVLPSFINKNNEIYNTDQYHFHDRWYAYKYSADNPNAAFSILCVKNMPYKSLFKRRSNTSFMARLDNMIYRNEIEPFLLFINNRFVPWDNIQVIHDCDDNYLKVHGYQYNYYAIKKIDMIVFPFNISCTTIESDYLFDRYYQAIVSYINDSAQISDGKLKIKLPGILQSYKYDNDSLSIGSWYYNQIRLKKLKLLPDNRYAKLIAVPVIKNVHSDSGELLNSFNTTVNLFDKDSYDIGDYDAACNVTLANEIFRFNSDGLLDDEGKTIITTIDSNAISLTNFSFKEINDTVCDVYDTLDNKVFKENYFVFKNGMLCTDYSLKISLNNTFKLYGLDKTLDYNEDGTTYSKETNNTIVCKIFNSNLLKPAIMNASYFKNDAILNNRALSYLKDGVDPGYIEDSTSELNFAYKNNTILADNIDTALDAVIQYDPSLLNNIHATNIYTKCIKGSVFNESLDIPFGTDDKYGLKIPRSKYENNETYTLVFINGILLDTYNTMKIYQDHLFFEVNEKCHDDDTIEIMYFIRCNNNELSFTYHDHSGCHIFDNIIPKTDLKLFSIDVRELLSYPNVNYNLDRIAFPVYSNKDNEIGIVDGMDNKQVVAVSSRKFIYERFIIDQKAYKIKLGKQFRYCDNQNQYVLFINGRRIIDSYYLVSIPKITRPFDNMYIYLSKFVDASDRIELFYLPEELTNINTPMKDNALQSILQFPLIGAKSYLMTNGYLKVNTDLNLPIDKNYYLFFINGKKIPSEWIYRVNTKTIRITRDTLATNDLIINCITKDKIDKVAECINSKDSNLDIITNQIIENEDLGYDELDKLYGEYIQISNSESNYMKRNVGRIAIINEIVRDFWVTSGYDYQAKPFVYDYITDEFKSQDENSNWILPSLDAIPEININKYDLHHLYFCFMDDMPEYFEYGTIIQNPTFAWDYSAIYYDDIDLVYQKFNGSNISNALREFQINTDIEEDCTYTLESYDGFNKCESEINIKFANGVYYGIIDEDAMDGNNSDIFSNDPQAIFSGKYPDEVQQITKIIQPTTSLDINQYVIGNTNYFFIAVPKRLALDENGKEKITFFCPDITTDEFKNQNRDDKTTPIYTNGKMDNTNSLIELDTFEMERFIGNFDGEFEFKNENGYKEKYVIYKSTGFFTRLYDNTTFNIYVR